MGEARVLYEAGEIVLQKPTLKRVMKNVLDYSSRVAIYGYSRPYRSCKCRR